MRALSKWLLLLCLVVLASPGPVLAKDLEPTPIPTLESVVTMQVDGAITIDPTGQVAEFRVDTPLSEDLRAALDRVVLKWRFQPVVIDGTPRVAQAKMRIVLAAHKAGEIFQVKIDNVVFPGDASQANRENPARISAVSLRPPAYPGGLNRAGVSGMVLLGIRVSADGRAEQVAAIQSMLFDIRGRDAVLAEAIRELERSALSAARRWTFKVGADNGQLTAKDMTVTVPVEYSIRKKGRAEMPGKWRTIVRAPKRPLEWLRGTPGVQKIGVSDIAAGEVIPVASAVKLVTEVVGTDLM